MINMIIICALIGVVFWQPAMSSNYSPEPRRNPSKRERYIANIDRLIEKGEYDNVAHILSKPKYQKEYLPIAYWRELISEKKGKIIEEFSKIESLKNLEKILGS
jgi:hypothetical protein